MASYEKSPLEIEKSFDRLKTERHNFESQWQEVADYMLPRKDQITRTRSPGEKRGMQILDNTGIISLELLAGAMHTFLTNPSEQWFQLTTGDAELDDVDGVRRWLQRSSVKIRNVLNNSNFQTEVHEMYIDEVAFGTAVLSCEEDEGPEIVSFMSRPIACSYLEEDQSGRVCGVYREFEFTAEEAAAEYGFKFLPKKIQDAFNKKDMSKFRFIHYVYKVKDYGTGEKKPRFPILSVIINCETKEVVKKGGFTSYPYITPRWMKISGEKYGRSPAMAALPDMKTLNAMTDTTLRGAQKVVDPPLQAPDDGFIMPIITKPGGLNYYRAGTQDRLTPIFNDARIDFGFEVMEQKKKQVRQAFYVDQLKLQEGPQMTATEVLQRTEEGMRLLGPVIGRMQSEFLRPLISRVMDIMDKRKMFDELPQELRDLADNGKELDVQYSSLIAQTQRLGDAQNILRTIQASEPFINADPTVLDNINGDQAIRTISRIYNFPQQILRNTEEVEQIRKARADAQKQMLDQQKQAQEAETLNQTAKAGAEMAKAQR